MRARRLPMVTAGILFLTMMVVAPANAQTYGEVSGTLKCPGSGPITVSGEGYASLATVAVEWDNPLTLLATTIADPQGAISQVVDIPPLALEGEHEIRAKGKGRDGGTLVLKCRVKVSILVVNGETLISASPASTSSANQPWVVGGIGAGLAGAAGLLARRRRSRLSSNSDTQTG